MNWCILIPLLVGAICALLGYLLGKFLGDGGSHDDCNTKISKLEAELRDCKASKAKSSNSNINVASSFAGAAAGIAFNSGAAKAVFGKKVIENDLTIVEGIGPKIKELFHKNNVNTWKGLSECSVEKCQSILATGGDRYKIHTPRTWPEQAKLAYEGKWEALLKWQDELDGGK